MDPESGAASAQEISQLLERWASRDPAARDRLVPLVYEELRRLAHYMSGERAGHTLQTTALVNEAYLRLAGVDRMQWRGRAHFFAMAATLMRRILVEHAREQARQKRGGGVSIASLEDRDMAGPAPEIEVMALDEALAKLAAFDEQQSRIVELRFFGGLTAEESAEALGISAATVGREWVSAKAWLHHELTRA